MGIRRDFSDHEVALRDTGFRPEAAFDTAVRGYDRDQVRRYADRVERTLTELAVRQGRAQARERELMTQIAELRADMIAQDRDEQVNRLTPAQYLGGRMEQLLAESEQLSAGVLEDAHTEAERIRAAARDDAEAARAAAHQDAEAARTAARNDAEATRTAARNDAESMRTAAAEDAKVAVADAQHRAGRIVDEARQEAARILGLARERYDKAAAVRHAVHEEIVEVLRTVSQLAGPAEEPVETGEDAAEPLWLVNNAPRPRRPDDVQARPAGVPAAD
ncbi:hypothetical protein GCM10022220_12670 [Actinocatenispora rupis]|uniref:DivIVA domain-containing protein n=1 Tax=Actinocatenispora rupis TaxID=519421 RepID=A0A8J3J797_9ACTN|nr:hypothetical protein Aru02nite_06270 [Actinocatenispora rupis]